MGNRLRRLIRPGSVIRLIFSLALGLVVWGFIVWETNPERTHVESSVPVEVVNLPANMRIVDDLPTVSITMKGPQDVVEDITPASVSAHIDLDEVTTVRTVERRVQVDVPSGLREVIVEPETVEIEVDEFISSTFPIEIDETSPRPANVDNVEIGTRLVEVRGSRLEVSEIQRVVAPLDLSERQDSFTEEVSLKPVDANDREVPGVTLVPDSVEISVSFSTTQRFVPVTVICRCVSDGQLEIAEFPEAAAIPSTVQISGSDGLISEISSVPTEPIDISSLEESGWILDVDIDASQLPPEVELTETTVDVWVPIELQRSTFEDVPITVINVEDGLSASIPDPTASFSVRGPRSILEELEGSPPSVVVDASGRTAGSYVVEVRVILPPEVAYERLSPLEVQLTLQRELSPQRWGDVPPTVNEIRAALPS